MKFKFLLVSLLAAAITFSGCSIIPKKVEFFQDKVHSVPELKPREVEVQRQAAKLASIRATDVFVAAVSEGSSTNVVIPARDVVELTSAVSTSLGPPLNPTTSTPEELSKRLDSAVAALNRRLDDFKQDNNENAGKKIEGTGLFQIPYFVWVGGVLIFVFFLLIAASIGWSILKVFALSNPPVALGMNVASMGAKTIGKGFTQVVKGGEAFKERVNTEIEDKQIAAKVLSMFQSEQKKAQNDDVQAVVQHLTK